MSKKYSKYEKCCPLCSRIQTYSNHVALWTSKKVNALCRSCSKKGMLNPSYGKSSWMKGKHHTAEAKKKMSINHISTSTEYKSGINHPYYGKPARNKGITQVAWNKGKKASLETKRKNRMAKFRRLETLGIPPKEDRGAREFFAWINGLGYNFVPKRFMNVGYDADGYCNKSHIWCEFDTPYHSRLYQKKKDLVRQQNIIEHFQKIGNPLKGFWRVQADKNGQVLGSKIVYKG